MARYVLMGHAPIPERKWAIRDRVPLKQAGTVLRRRRHRQEHHRTDEECRSCGGKGLAGLDAGAGAGVLSRRRGRQGRNPHPPRGHRQALRRHVQGTDRRRPAHSPAAWEGCDALRRQPRAAAVEVDRSLRQIYEAAGDIKPKNISIDTLSRAFAGNEIDRVQVYAFAMHMQALAMVAEGSVTVLSHPSLPGISSGSGLSGSTAWHGAFRFRQYLKGVKASDGEQPDNDLRELEFKKNQYGPRGDSIVLRYQRGPLPARGGVSPTSTRRHAPPRPKRCLWICCAALRPGP